MTQVTFVDNITVENVKFKDIKLGDAFIWQNTLYFKLNSYALENLEVKAYCPGWASTSTIGDNDLVIPVKQVKIIHYN